MRFNNQKITVMGLGTHGGGSAVVRYLCQQGAQVTVTDLASEASLKSSLAEIADLPIERYCLASHDTADFERADMVVVNPAVRPGNRFVELARNAGAAITTEMEIFLQACPARIAAITGTNGKTTTATMLASIVKRSGQNCYLGGNIGHSLLSDLSKINKEDWIVLEISSFQLAQLEQSKKYFEIAMVTNCQPNHLNWHADFADYVSAKKRMFDFLVDDGVAILGETDPQVNSWMHEIRQEIKPLVAESDIPQLQVVGKHNRQNARLAATAAQLMGCDDASIQSGLKSFVGLPHRIQKIATINDRDFYNDSKSTTPGATIAAIEAMQRSTWLILGGTDKGSDFTSMLQQIAERAKGVAFYGEIAEKLSGQMKDISSDSLIYQTETLDMALAWCWQNSQPEEDILLSPACASFDQFRDFVHRGEHFISLVERLTTP